MLNYEKIKTLLKSSLERHWENDDEIRNEIADYFDYTAIYPYEEAEYYVQQFEELGCKCYIEDELYDNRKTSMLNILIPIPK